MPKGSIIADDRPGSRQVVFQETLGQIVDRWRKRRALSAAPAPVCLHHRARNRGISDMSCTLAGEERSRGGNEEETHDQTASEAYAGWS